MPIPLEQDKKVKILMPERPEVIRASTTNPEISAKCVLGEAFRRFRYLTLIHCISRLFTVSGGMDVHNGHHVFDQKSSASTSHY